MGTVSTFSFPTTVDFGAGAIGRLADRARQLGGTRLLVVSDRGLEPTPALAKVRAQLDAGGVAYALFFDVHPNPVEADVDAAADVYRREQCDLVVGVGGGSALDAAKAVRLRVTHDEPLAAYDDLADGASRVRDVLPPMIAVPTTAGTGSEVGRACVVTIPSLGRKVVIFSPCLIPTVAIDDPELTVGLPAHLTAATGMDALVHSLEALVATGYHPLAEAIALEGLRLCARSLARAVEQGSDIGARTDMMMASMMGAIAFQKGLGATHSLAHPLSSELGMHHGLANALCVEPVVRFNRDAAAYGYVRAACCFGYAGSDPAVGAPEPITGRHEAIDFLVDTLGRLRHEIGIPASLRAAGVPRDALPGLADKALEDGCHQGNPRPCTRDDLLGLYEQAYG